MSKIKSLTPKQEQELIEYRKRYFDIGTCTEQADWDAAEAVISGFYQSIDKAVPQFVHCDSPLTAQLAMHLIESGDSLWASLWDSLEDSLRASLWASLEASLRASLRDRKIGYQHSSLWGQQDVYWIGFYKFCQHIGVPFDKQDAQRLDQWDRLARSCMWWWPFEGTCFISNRPSAIRMNAEDRLHADGEPSVEFRDGFKIYNYNGVLVPEKYGAVKTKGWQAKWLLEEENAELRRVLIQGIGYEKLLHELEAEPVSSWREYELVRIKGQLDVEPVQLLSMDCHSTGRKHVLRVPPDITEARAAIRWCNWDIDAETFRGES